MACVTVLRNGRPAANVQVRAWTTGGHGKWDSKTDNRGECKFDNNANRTQISVYNGYRWVDIGPVQSSLRGDITVNMP